MSNSEEEIIIPPDTKKLRHDDDAENENEDRLSHLHDCVLLHILSFLSAKYAVRTCILSTRWKHLWKHIPTLILHFLDFSTLEFFTKFVSRILSFRDDSISLHELNFSGSGSMELPLLQEIVKYAISHNVQRLGLSVECEIEQIPSSIFSCQTLTYLKLYCRGSGGTLFPRSLNLPALTGLYLGNFAFGAENDLADPFLTFNKLNSLVLFHCSVDIDAELFSNCVDPSLIVFSWLLGFTGIKSLVLSASTLQVLSFVPSLLMARLPFLGDLKLLKVKKRSLSYGLWLKLRVAKLQKAKSRREVAKLTKELKGNFTLSPPLPDGIVDFLLQNSPSAKVEIIDFSSNTAIQVGSATPDNATDGTVRNMWGVAAANRGKRVTREPGHFNDFIRF